MFPKPSRVLSGVVWAEAKKRYSNDSTQIGPDTIDGKHLIIWRYEIG